MEYILPLIQTMLWVGLIIWIIWRFHKPIDGILAALQKRVESGSSIKAGPFEITDKLRPQAPEEQRKKAVEEIEEALREEAPERALRTAAASRPNPAQIHARYFHAEDLVLRAIQAEQGVTINRQLTAGSDMGFDGVFVESGRLNIVEVKYTRSISSLPRFKPTIERLNAAIARYGWKNVQIVLAVVFENDTDLPKAEEKMQKIASVSSVPLVVRCYSYNELISKFGVGDSTQ